MPTCDGVTNSQKSRCFNTNYIGSDLLLNPFGFKNIEITFVTGAGIILERNGDTNAGAGQKCNKATSEFICNHADWDEY